MHILFISDNFFPEVNAPATRTFEHAKEWVKQGHKVTVITCTPNFPHGRIYDGYKNRFWQSEVLEGVEVIRVWSFIAQNKGIFLRILDFTSFMVSSFIASFFVRGADIIVGTSPQFFACVSAWMISSFKNVPFVFELRDLWPASLAAVEAINSSVILNVTEKLEIFLYNRSDIIISLTNAFKTNLENRGIDPKKIHIVTNGVDRKAFFKEEKDAKLLEELGLAKKFVVGYIGTIGMAHGLETVLRAAKIIQNRPNGKKIHFLFLGDGANKEELKNLALKLKLSNTLFKDTVSKTDVKRYWSILDLSIVHLKKNELFKTVIPSKIFEAMATGTPILHAVEGESADIIKKTGAGIVVMPDNEEYISSKLLDLSTDQEMLAKYSKLGLRASIKYDRQELAMKMLLILQAAIESKS